MRNKKILLLIFIFVFIGATIAYYFTRETFSNEFSLAEFDTSATETFTSPANWKPGDTTDKIVSVTNNKSLPAAVRVSYEEKWYDKDNHLIDNPVDAVTINLNKPSKWRKEGKYYYYIYPLLKDETVVFMNSVTFNKEFGDSQSCTIDGNVEICNSNFGLINGGTYKLIITIETVQYDAYHEAWDTDVAIGPKKEPESFATDSWDTIVEAVESGDTIPYEVGDTKTIEMDIDNDGTPETYTLRIANTSTPEACASEDFSQTACGFVVEFSTFLKSQNKMNLTSSNVGGWEASEMRRYVNNDVYNLLPDDLKYSIINTKVVSGHGKTTGEENFVTTDKIYLLSSVEVWGTPFRDTLTAENPALTRQLDYYESLGVTTSTNKEGAIKRNVYGTASFWWLRTAANIGVNGFCYVQSGGGAQSNNANNSFGVAPAFRIG